MLVSHVRQNSCWILATHETPLNNVHIAPPSAKPYDPCMNRTRPIPSQILASLSRNPPPAPPAKLVTPTNTVPSKPANPAFLRVALNDLSIDIGQPRKYLPPDLRDVVATRKLAPTEALAQLAERVAKGDIEATGFFESIRTLANGIAQVGLQYPLLVSQNGDGTFTVIDGERRYWALLYLQHQPYPTPLDPVPVIVADPASSGDDLKRLQWIVNLQREDVAPIDVAEAIWRIREDYLAQLNLDRSRFAGELGEQGALLTPLEAANLLTSHEVTRLTGRTLARATLYRHLFVAERLTLQARPIARAHRVSLRRLRGVACLPEAQQVQEMLRAAIQENDLTLSIPKPDNAAPSPGRPTVLRRNGNLCLSLIQGLQKMSDKHLTKTSAEECQTFLAQLEDTASEIKRMARLVQSHLTRANP